MSDTLLTLPRVEIEAASGKPPRLRIVAYTGTAMNLVGFGPTVIDLAAIELPETVTLLADHENELRAIVGSGRPKIQGGRTLVIDGTLAADTDAGKQVLALLAAGVQLGASVGVEVKERQFVREGEAVKVNGLEHVAPTGGMSVVTAGVLRETSIVAVGADRDTSVSLAAMAAMNGAFPMSGTTEVDPIKAERDRVKRINAMFEMHAATRDRCIEAGLDLKDAELEFLRAERAAAELEAVRSDRPRAPMPGRPMPDGADAKSLLSCALMLRAGQTGIAEKAFGARVVQAAADLRCRSLVDVCAASLALAHVETPMGRHELIQASFSTSALSGALRDSLAKVALARYRESPATWRSIARPVPVRDFRTSKMIRAVFGGSFSRVAPGGELRHGFLDSESFTIQADTSGLMLGINRQDIINDDASLLSDTGPALGAAGARAVADEVYRVLLANLEPDGSTPFFTAERGNYREGSDTALGLTSVADAVTAMVSRTDAEGRVIDVRPRTLLLPPELEAYGRQIVQSTLVARTGDQEPQGNPLAGLLEPVCEPRLSNAAITGNSAKAWYLFSQPGDGAIVVAFLDGRDGPVVEEVQGPPEVLGMFWRAYIDFGVSLGDWRACTKVLGEAEA